MNDDNVTQVSTEQFDQLLADSTTPGVPNAALRAAAERARQQIVQRASEPDRCPCGHDTASGYYMCINGLIYGPCENEYCGGVCEANGPDCTHPDCACKED